MLVKIIRLSPFICIEKSVLYGRTVWYREADKDGFSVMDVDQASILSGQITNRDHDRWISLNRHDMLKR